MLKYPSKNIDKHEILKQKAEQVKFVRREHLWKKANAEQGKSKSL